MGAQNLPHVTEESKNSGAVSSGGKLSDAAAALAVLGYSNAEINVALRGIDAEALALEEIIRLALKNMLKQ